MDRKNCMKKILITGSKGQVGRALNDLFQNLEKKDDYKIWNTTRNIDPTGEYITLDITKEDQVVSVIEKYQPDIVINCAAHTGVDLCETQEEEAYKSNALGPAYLAKEVEKIGGVLVHISTDYVFDGTSNKPYTEEDPVGPCSVYGKTKLQGEEYVKKYCSKYFILRIAWVYGEGKNFVKTMLRLSETMDTIRVVNDQHGQPTSAMEVARAIYALINTNEYGVYHVTCEGETTWYDFAKVIFDLANKSIEVIPITSDEYKTPAKRPSYSVLDNKNLRLRLNYEMKHWKEAFLEYWNEKGV